MSEYNYCEEIKTKYKVDEFNSKTLSYRINGFIKACNMNLENSVCNKDISTHRLEYDKLEYVNNENNKIQYTINLTKNTSDDAKVSLVGKYDDLSFSFINYIDEDEHYNKIRELPFRLSLTNEFDGFKYDLEINTISKYRTKFIIRKGKEEMLIPYIISFQANILDFSLVLKLIKSFVINPDLVFTSYSDVMNKKNPTITCSDLGKGIVEDESLNEPVKGIKKIIRSLFK